MWGNAWIRSVWQNLNLKSNVLLTASLLPRGYSHNSHKQAPKMTTGCFKSFYLTSVVHIQNYFNIIIFCAKRLAKIWHLLGILMSLPLHTFWTWRIIAASLGYSSVGLWPMHMFVSSIQSILIHFLMLNQRLAWLGCLPRCYCQSQELQYTTKKIQLVDIILSRSQECVLKIKREMSCQMCNRLASDGRTLHFFFFHWCSSVQFSLLSGHCAKS